jgi:hypothetical protein
MADSHYQLVMRDAREEVLLVAARRAIDTRLIAVEFDDGRGPGPHEEHSLTISVGDLDLAVHALGSNRVSQNAVLSFSCIGLLDFGRSE